MEDPEQRAALPIEHQSEDTEDGLVLATQLGRVVQRLREAEGHTKEDLADLAGLHRTYIGLVERGERHLGVAAATSVAHALGLRLSDLIGEAERELKAAGHDIAPALFEPELQIVVVPTRRSVNPNHLENDESLRALTGLGVEWIASAIDSTYGTLDLIDEKMAEMDTPPVALLFELANVSSMIGNLLGGGLAKASAGIYERNRPHAYPDLLPLQDGTPPAEIKTALETNTPKGHLPKAGLHITFRYVLGLKDGMFTRGKESRGDTAWIWEVRIGDLTEDDYSVSNTEGDSGKTAVIKAEAFQRMTRLYFNPSLYPYAKLSGPYGTTSTPLL